MRMHHLSLSANWKAFLVEGGKISLRCARPCRLHTSNFSVNAVRLHLSRSTNSQFIVPDFQHVDIFFSTFSQRRISHFLSPFARQQNEPFAMMMSTTGHRKPWAQPGNWETLKPVIERLYMKEGKKLKEVMAEMEKSHGFRAT
jgi:hypothetical protein